MGSDLEDILRAAGADRARPGLIEVGRSVSPGAGTVGYFWSTGRISATVSGGRVKLRRRRGVIADDDGEHELVLAADELTGLSTACAAWARDRDEWAAFYYSSGGYPPGYGGACYYQAPGKDGARVKIGSSGPYHRNGADLVGHEEVRPIEPLRLGDTVAVNAELWWIGEPHGPAAGAFVGVRFEIGDAICVDARRDDARASRKGGGSVYVEQGEEAFVSAVVDVLKRVS